MLLRSLQHFMHSASRAGAVKAYTLLVLALLLLASANLSLVFTFIGYDTDDPNDNFYPLLTYDGVRDRVRLRPRVHRLAPLATSDIAERYGAAPSA